MPFLIRLFPFIIAAMFINAIKTMAQSDIKVANQKINHLDKKKKKQGEWIYFNDSGLVIMTCIYENDKCISPMIFFENSDTAFIRLPMEDSVETFVVYDQREKYIGDFIYEKDSIIRIDVETGGAIPDSLIRKIKKYKDLEIPPVYYFGQMPVQDYITSAFSSVNFTLNKPINARLYIDASGIVTEVDFPADKNNLTGNQERDLRWIYRTMPRWQPMFRGNKTIPGIFDLKMKALFEKLGSSPTYDLGPRS